MQYTPGEFHTTYSIVARDPETGQFGVAVETHQMCVGRAVPWLLPGVGAVATQSLTNMSFGPLGLAMLAQGVGAKEVIAGLIASDPGADRRQVAAVDAKGEAAAWTGTGCIAEAGHHVGQGYSVQANMMTRPTVIAAMRDAFERASGDLAQRMMVTLQAAQAEDGDIRGMQSAALVVVPGQRGLPERENRIYDLRVDEHANPVTELARLVRLRGANLLDSEGHKALDAGERDRALSLWEEARQRAPEMEEMAFWQAATLADKPGDVQTAAAILRPALAGNDRREHWLDLLRRLEACKLLERAGAAEELIQAL